MFGLHDSSVYRIETKKGQGPYRGGVLDCETLWDDFFDDRIHPGPFDDLILCRCEHLFITGDYIFGFAALQDVYKWFHADKVISELKKKGFFISKYFIHKDDIVFGEKQLIFNKRKCRLVEHITLVNAGSKL